VTNAGEVHIASGDSAAGCLREVLRLDRAELLVNHDLLSCGPLPPLAPLDRWRAVRERFLIGLSPEGPGFSFEASDRDLLTHATRLTSAARLTLWIGTGLAEQLLLIWVVEVCRHLGADPARVQVVQFATVGRGFEVVGTGALHPDELRMAPEAVGLDERALDEVSRAWAAVTAATPDALLHFLADGDHPLPFLRRSLRALLYHYPDVQGGVNAWERELLRHVREDGPRLTRVVGFTMGEDLPFPEWASDGYLWDRLRRLGDSRLARPLVVLSGDTSQMRTTEVRLTADGEAILDRRGHFVDWNGIDDHVAGVHLRSAVGAVWYRDGETLVRV
jgi:hypothetical protein